MKLEITLLIRVVTPIPSLTFHQSIGLPIRAIQEVHLEVLHPLTLALFTLQMAQIPKFREAIGVVAQSKGNKYTIQQAQSISQNPLGLKINRRKEQSRSHLSCA